MPFDHNQLGQFDETENSTTEESVFQGRSDTSWNTVRISVLRLYYTSDGQQTTGKTTSDNRIYMIFSISVINEYTIAGREHTSPESKVTYTIKLGIKR